ncbi:Uncharacterised protein [Mycobacteroides abscessus subsp. abscessus]|nr:Uncharacterised protein [Mycobacteroides abscessus subsp. abscessus]
MPGDVLSEGSALVLRPELHLGVLHVGPLHQQTGSFTGALRIAGYELCDECEVWLPTFVDAHPGSR